MPRGRFLSRDISTSERLRALESDAHRMLWTWSVPWLDREGRLPGSPRVLLATVVPMLDHWTTDDVVDALSDFERVGLAQRYTDAAGRRAVQFWNFREHQRGMRADREAPSKFGPNPDMSGPCRDVPEVPETNQVPQKSGPGPAKVGVREGEDQDQGKGKASSRKRPKRPIPDGWKPNDTACRYAGKHRLSVTVEAEDFRTWTAAKDTRFVDWDKAFLSHLQRRVKWAAERGHPTTSESLPLPTATPIHSPLPGDQT